METAPDQPPGLQPGPSPRIGIDLGGTKIEIIVMQADGEISHRQRSCTPQGDYQGTLQVLNQLIFEVTKEENLPDKLPIGIGTPGAVSLKTGLMMNCNSTCLNDQPLQEDLEKLTGKRVRIANDADCFALSEASDGVGATESTIFGVILGTGVGGGIVLDKQLHKGVNAISGEWGHNTLPIHSLRQSLPDLLLHSPRHCFCGRHHCVETWISGPAFEHNFRLQSGEILSARNIIGRMKEGDALATEVFEQYEHLLALALANVINILDPAAIVLGGGLSNIDELYRGIPRLLPEYVFSDVIHTKILKAKYGDSSGVRGAAWLWSVQDVEQILENS